MAAPTITEPPIEVQLIADFACPWCYLGLARFERARAMRPERAIELVWRPFFLNPNLPPEGMDRASLSPRQIRRRGRAGLCADRGERARRRDSTSPSIACGARRTRSKPTA